MLVLHEKTCPLKLKDVLITYEKMCPLKLRHYLDNIIIIYDYVYNPVIIIIGFNCILGNKNNIGISSTNNDTTVTTPLVFEHAKSFHGWENRSWF